jgi:hypothetical protein
MVETGGNSEPLLVYLSSTVEALGSFITAYDDAPNDDPQRLRYLVRALHEACLGLSRFAEDSLFWDELAVQAPNSSLLRSGSNLDEGLEQLIDAEQHLLTQAGMPPRYVAILLNDVETAVRTLLTSDGDFEDAKVAAERLHGRVRSLANETCNRWHENEAAIKPSQKPGGAVDSPRLSASPSRLRRLAKRAFLVLGGAVVVTIDAVAGAHGAIPDSIAGASAGAGFSLMTAGCLDLREA